MHWNSSRMKDLRVSASDGDVGPVEDWLFDDAEWTVRWIVVDAGSWFGSRKVLLPPTAMRTGEDGALLVDATRRQVKDSPGIDADAPVSRQREAALHQHYGRPPYWAAPRAQAAGAPAANFPPPVAAPNLDGEMRQGSDIGEENRPGDPHLRSAREVTGYRVTAGEAEVGRINDFIAELSGGAIRELIVETADPLHGRRTLAPADIHEIDYAARTARTRLSREEIERAPPYQPHRPAADV